MAYKEKDTKKWTAQWFETNARGEKKKRRKRGFETKREALEYERQKKLNNSRSMDMKLSEFMEVYFEDKQNELKERTMKNKRYMMEQHIIPYFGNQMMSEITAGQIIQWQNEMQTKGFSEAYLRMIQNQLTSLFTHAFLKDKPRLMCRVRHRDITWALCFENFSEEAFFGREVRSMAKKSTVNSR